jgi:hypothetical protein
MVAIATFGDRHGLRRPSFTLRAGALRVSVCGARGAARLVPHARESGKVHVAERVRPVPIDPPVLLSVASCAKPHHLQRLGVVAVVGADVPSRSAAHGAGVGLDKLATGASRSHVYRYAVGVPETKTAYRVHGSGRFRAHGVEGGAEQGGDLLRLDQRGRAARPPPVHRRVRDAQGLGHLPTGHALLGHEAPKASRKRSQRTHNGDTCICARCLSSPT